MKTLTSRPARHEEAEVIKLRLEVAEATIRNLNWYLNLQDIRKLQKLQNILNQPERTLVCNETGATLAINTPEEKEALKRHITSLQECVELNGAAV